MIERDLGSLYRRGGLLAEMARKIDALERRIRYLEGATEQDAAIWQEWTNSALYQGGALTLTNKTARYRIVGRTVELHYGGRIGTAGTAGSRLYVPDDGLPAVPVRRGLSPPGSLTNVYGTAAYYDDDATGAGDRFYVCAVVWSSGLGVEGIAFVPHRTGSEGSPVYLGETGTLTAALGDQISFTCLYEF